jgi:hypothetical protein
MALLTRDVQQGKYTVKSRQHNAVTHMQGFLAALGRLQAATGVTDQDIELYTEAVASDAQAYSDRDKNHPEFPEGSPLPDPK